LCQRLFVTSSDPTPNETRSESLSLPTRAPPPPPATIPNNSRVTIVGEVTGATMQRLDETDYRYLTVDIKHLHVWEPASSPWWSGFDMGLGVFGGSGGARGGGGGRGG